MKKVLILGGSGLVGRAIIDEFSKYSEFDFYSTYFNNKISSNENKTFKLNIEDEEDIIRILNTVKPSIVVSCLRGNFDKQLILHIKTAEYLKKNNGKLYFFSTANVFDNDLSKPHYEDDLLTSHTDYGLFKIECENKITEILEKNICILRIPQVWGKDSPRMKSLLKSLNSNEEVIVYPKFFYNTNTDVNIAKQLHYIINNNLNGVFHLGAEDVISYKDFYNQLILGLGFKNSIIKEDYKQEGYFALDSKRKNVFPNELKLTNKSVIDYLI